MIFIIIKGREKTPVFLLQILLTRASKSNSQGCNLTSATQESMLKNKTWSELETESCKTQTWDWQSSFFSPQKNEKKRSFYLQTLLGQSELKPQECLQVLGRTQGRTQKKSLNQEETEAQCLSLKLSTGPGRLLLSAQKWQETSY